MHVLFVVVCLKWLIRQRKKKQDQDEWVLEKNRNWWERMRDREWERRSLH